MIRFVIAGISSEIDFQASEVQAQLAIDPATGRIVLVPVIVTSEESAIESGPIARANIRKQWSNLARSEFSYNRSVSPTVFGAQSVTDDVLLTFERELTSRFVAVFRGGYTMRSAETDAIDGQRGNLNRDQVLLVGGIRYRIKKEMSIGATYRFVYNELNDLNETSSNNGLFINFRYNGEPQIYRGF